MADVGYGVGTYGKRAYVGGTPFSPPFAAGGVAVELKLSGGWVDVSNDVLLTSPLRWRRGIAGHQPNDRVAAPGTLSFALNNSASNSGALNGYYSPGHANVRAGFAHGTRVRLILATSVTVYRYVFYGRIKTIAPEPGTYGSKRTFITAADMMDTLSMLPGLELTLQTSKRSDQLIQTVLDELEEAPKNTSLDTGSETLTFGFDDLGGNTPAALQVIHDICMTEGGYFYVAGDANAGETARFENRSARATAATALTLTDADMRAPDGFEVPSDLSKIHNDIEVVTYPRRVGGSNEVLVSLDREIEVDAAETFEAWADYRDPSNEATWVGGQSMVQPVANTDFTANDTAGGGGSDVTASFAVVATYFGSTVKLEITNNTAATGYLRGPGGADGMQCRGIKLSRYAPVVARQVDTSSVGTYGTRKLVVTMPYQDNEQVATDYAVFLKSSLAQTANVPTRVRVLTEQQATFASAIPIDIGSRVVVSEPITAVTSAAAFVNAIEGEVVNGRVGLWWTLAPEAGSDFFIFDTSVFDTGRFGF